MVTKKQFESAIKVCKARIIMYETKIEKITLKIEKVKEKFRNYNLELKEDLEMSQAETYNEADGDIFSYLRWLEAVNSKEAEIREAIKDVSKCMIQFYYFL